MTICTQNREHYFGEIVKNNNDEPEMVLTPIGRFTEEQLRNVTQHYPYAEIPLWVVMPNHIHAIVVIDDAILCRDVARNVSTAAMDDSGKNEYMAQKSPKNGTLAVVIRGIKSAVTKFANENNIPFAWQTRFFDHIVRNQNEMNGIAEYIEKNVAKWELDKFYNNE